MVAGIAEGLASLLLQPFPAANQELRRLLGGGMRSCQLEDAFGVRFFQNPGQHTDVASLAVGDALAQIDAGHELHGEEARIALLIDAEDPPDVRVVQRRERLRLALEPTQALLVARELVVDVKTPLDAYLEANEAKNDAQRKLGLERHAKNVRNHIRALASKAYWQQFEKSPEFVILFIPGDQFLSAALNEEPDLIETALAQHIMLATPTSLVALLKAVAYSWRQVALTDNAKEIRKLAEDLYGRLSVFASHMNRVGKQLASSVENYNKAVGSLERNVLPGARKFKELGVHEKREIEKLETLDPVPRTMIESSADEDDDKTLQ